MTDAPDLGPRYDLTLFVSGLSDLSALAIANATRLCDTHLAGRYVLAVVDVHADPSAVFENDVLAAPTLVRNHPTPVRKVIGDLTDTTKVLLAFGITPVETATTVTSAAPSPTTIEP